ncbi:Dynactin subunit 5, partial [Atta colombica]
IIKGDLANVRTGRYCIISKNTVIRSPFKKFSGGYAIPSYSIIFVYRQFVLKDCCHIEDSAVVIMIDFTNNYEHFLSACV